MKFRQYIVKIGNIFFRWRSFWPFIILPVLFFALKSYSYKNYQKSSYTLLCFTISIFGLFIRCMVIGYAPKGTSGRVSKQVAEMLNTKGMYSLIRHPLYLGNFFIFLGMILYTKIWWFIFVSIIIFWFYYGSIIMAEEKFLKDKFGENFLKYKKTIPAIIPEFKKWQKPDLPFSFKNVINKEYQTFFGILVGFTFVDTLIQIFSQKKLTDTFLIKAFIISFLIYLIVIFLKTKTTLLNVEGR